MVTVVNAEQLAALEADTQAREAAAEAALLQALSAQRAMAARFSELRGQLEAAEREAVAGLDPFIASLSVASLPELPFEAHRVRVNEAKRQALAARAWVADMLMFELARFSLTLDATGRIALDAEQVVARLARRPGAHGGPEDGCPVVTHQPVNPRILISTVVDLTSASNIYTGRTENISRGGVFVATDESFELGSEVDLTLTLIGATPFRARGEVRWHREATAERVAGVGVAFLSLSDAARDALEAFLNLREPIYYEVDAG